MTMPDKPRREQALDDLDSVVQHLRRARRVFTEMGLSYVGGDTALVRLERAQPVLTEVLEVVGQQETP
jgi:hypothetical protein